MLVPRLRNVHMSRPVARTPIPTWTQRSAIDKDTDDQAILLGLAMKVSVPMMPAKPLGRSVSKTNSPSCRRSSGSRVRWDQM